MGCARMVQWDIMPCGGTERPNSRHYGEHVMAGNDEVREIDVRYREKEGWHLFTCDALPGLFVASSDRQKAFHDLPKAIKRLHELDHGGEWVVFSRMTYEAFLKMREDEQREARRIVEERTAYLASEGRHTIRYAFTAPETRAGA